ncbi:MAG: hypothetical protein M3396_01320 [Actinomycetota bacterium]|nr:hypothetical protein [Actinomycetota bacterium]MDQ3575569.1 hypothetical protein [Actinomycetota bacterium]
MTGTHANRHGVLALMCALALVAGACGGGDDNDSTGARTTSPTGAASTGANLAAADLPRFGLEPSDLPPGYRLREAPRLMNPSECLQILTKKPERIAELQSLAIQACYHTYWVKGPRSQPSVAETKIGFSAQESGVNSNRPGAAAFLLGDAGTASKALSSIRNGLFSEATGDVRRSVTEDAPVTGLGDEATPGVRLTTTFPDGSRSRLVVYVWRSGNVVAYLGGSDILGDFTEESLLELARKLHTRAKR